MKKCFAFLLSFSLVTAPIFSQEESYAQKSAQLTNKEVTKTRGRGASAGTDSSVGLSMLAWGVGMAVGISILAGLIKSSNGDAAHAHSD